LFINSNELLFTNQRDRIRCDSNKLHLVFLAQIQKQSSKAYRDKLVMKIDMIFQLLQFISRHQSDSMTAYSIIIRFES